ncbi:4-hydroxythreonine-4-phosphate dehydrogenase PdxA [Chloroflexota bacterium]
MNEQKLADKQVKPIKPVLAIPLGDAAGIGPEIVAKVAANSRSLVETTHPIIVGDQSVLEMGMKIGNTSFSYKIAATFEEAVNLNGLVLLHTNSLDATTIKIGHVSPVLGKEETENLIMCIDACKQGLIDGFCHAPLNKGAMKLGGFDYESEHELFAKYFGTAKYYGEINVVDGVWTSRVTSHIPLKEVSNNLTIDRVYSAINLAYETLFKAGYEKPRVAIAAVNPHAGDSGTCGREEIDVITPAVERAIREGRNVLGPYSADTLFIRAFDGEYDAVVTMYHDQGQIALKLKGFDRSVTVSAGQPNVITTPAHGTAYDIAGKSIAKTTAFEEAYHIATEMVIRERILKNTTT